MANDKEIVYDRDKDGDIDLEDYVVSEKVLELRLREGKARAHKRIAWTSMISMIVFTVLIFTPIISDERVGVLSDLLGLFYIAQAGIVGAYMGVTAWMSKN